MNFRDYTVLGKTGLKVSRLGVASGYGAPSSAVEKAYHEYGVNYFFWSSPRFRGGGMRDAVRKLARTERDKMVIALQTYDHQGMFMRHFLEKGLGILNIEFADILILGWFNNIPGSRVIDTALKLKAEGKVRYIGMSGHNRKTFGKMAVQPDCPVDVFMTRYNAVHSGAEKDIFPLLPDQNRPGITTYTTTCWGKLLKADNMSFGETPPAASDCYRFSISNDYVNLCLTGPKNEKEMDEALQALDKGPLSSDEMDRMRRIGDHKYKK